MKKSIIISLITLLGAVSYKSYAQQDAMVSQYIFNGLFLNPAYGGTHPKLNASLLYRNQWTGLTGAPKTGLFQIDGPLANDKMGLGGIVAYDKIGVTEQTDFAATYSYKINLNKKDKLSFGIKAGASNYKAKLSTLNYWDSNDEVFAGDVSSKLIPKFGFGTYYYGERYYLGLSIPTLMAYDKNYSFSLDVEKASYLRRHYYLNGGYVFDLNEKFKFKPTFLLKYVPNAPLQGDLSAFFLYQDMIWLGATYRTKNTFIVMAEYQTNNNIRIGYAFDYTTSQLRSFSNGTHEIMIAYEFGKDAVKTKTTRYF